MKLAGILFILISAGSFGVRMAWSLGKQSNSMRQLLQALQILRRLHSAERRFRRPLH